MKFIQTWQDKQPRGRLPKKLVSCVVLGGLFLQVQGKTSYALLFPIFVGIPLSAPGSIATIQPLAPVLETVPI